MRLTTKLLMAACALSLSAGQTAAPTSNGVVFTYNSLGDFSKKPPYPEGCHPYKDYNGKGGEVSNGRVECDSEEHYRAGNKLGNDLHEKCTTKAPGYVCIITKGPAPTDATPEPQLPTGS